MASPLLSHTRTLKHASSVIKTFQKDHHKFAAFLSLSLLNCASLANSDFAMPNVLAKSSSERCCSRLLGSTPFAFQTLASVSSSSVKIKKLPSAGVEAGVAGFSSFFSAAVGNGGPM